MSVFIASFNANLSTPRWPFKVSKVALWSGRDDRYLSILFALEISVFPGPFLDVSRRSLIKPELDEVIIFLQGYSGFQDGYLFILAGNCGPELHNLILQGLDGLLDGGSNEGRELRGSQDKSGFF